MSWSKRDRIWQAFIGVNKARIYLGSYKTKEAAALAYDEAAKMLYGMFAVLNFPVLPPDPYSTKQFASSVSEETVSPSGFDTG